MREEQSRREQFTQGSVSRQLPPSVTSGHQASLLLREQDESTSVSIDLEPGMGQQIQTMATMRDDTVSRILSKNLSFYLFILFYLFQFICFRTLIFNQEQTQCKI